MHFFKRLLELFGQAAEYHPLPYELTQKKPETAAGLALPETETVWNDDAQLRGLAQDYREGRTKWILASDMAELYANLDAANAGPADAGKISLHLIAPVSDWLAKLRADGLHLESEHRKTDGPLSLTGEAGMRLLGPQFIDEGHMAVSYGSRHFPAGYFASPLDTDITLIREDGAPLRLNFGIGTDFAGAIALMLLPEAPKPAGPQP
jgi:hypothetical protein